MSVNAPVGLEKINGRPIHSLQDVVQAFGSNHERFHWLEFEGDAGVEALDRAKADAANPEILKQYAIPSDHRP
jgi:hypothetical protein